MWLQQQEFECGVGATVIFSQAKHYLNHSTVNTRDSNPEVVLGIVSV